MENHWKIEDNNKPRHKSLDAIIQIKSIEEEDVLQELQSENAILQQEIGDLQKTLAELQYNIEIVRIQPTAENQVIQSYKTPLKALGEMLMTPVRSFSGSFLKSFKKPEGKKIDWEVESSSTDSEIKCDDEDDDGLVRIVKDESVNKKKGLLVRFAKVVDNVKKSVRSSVGVSSEVQVQCDDSMVTVSKEIAEKAVEAIDRLKKFGDLLPKNA